MRNWLQMRAYGAGGFSHSTSEPLHIFRRKQDVLTHQEISMKHMTKALVVGGLAVLAQTALANDSVFPGSSAEAGGRLPVQVTHADRYAKEAVTTTTSAFPGAAEDGIIGLPAKSTYADRHLGKPTRISQPTQDSGISAN